MELEDLYDLIDEMINVDMTEDAELGMRVREWYQKYNGEDEDSLEWDDLTEDGEWEQFLEEEGYE